ncbi:helix-turn-helix domain-containing protein [Desmospora profundinema]|uniref:DNA-binding XRE family transcriptional regulator n=1 Tax=Desmospora profundinema TaxID=1571184 RepID=A0ABU1IJT1_9BACL|nr:helix-turn-helix domain-containing protein [Desmospora profundinema]MDR6224249.1 DNA-binding XRE family transcriptional regulator [Desmospora profundinema]
MSIEIGHRLKQARESLGYTLEEMAGEIQIPAAYLAALEAGDWQHMPSPYYARAYLRTYGTRLGLDPRSLVQHLQRPGVGGQGSQTHRPSRLSQSQLATNRRGRVSPDPPIGEGRQRNVSRQMIPPSGGMEETVSGESPALSRREGVARRPTLPPDMPEPQELGLSPRTRQIQGLSDEEGHGGKEPPLRRSDKANGGGTPSRTSRSKRSQEENDKNTTLGTWYTRFLIGGAVLLIPATAGLVWLMVFSDADEPANPEPSDQQTVEEGEEGSGDEAPEASGAILTPLERGSNGPDRYELTNVDQIELKLTAKGECWFQIRNQEVGGMLEDKVLKAGDVFPFSYQDGQTLWLQLGSASNVDVTVNGQKVNTNYPGSKQIEINWAK